MIKSFCDVCIREQPLGSLVQLIDVLRTQEFQEVCQTCYATIDKAYKNYASGAIIKTKTEIQLLNASNLTKGKEEDEAKTDRDTGDSSSEDQSPDSDGGGTSSWDFPN